jgi:hypothetical protein
MVDLKSSMVLEHISVAASDIILNHENMGVTKTCTSIIIKFEMFV